MHLIIVTAYIATIKGIKLIAKKPLNDPYYGLTTKWNIRSLLR